MKEVEKIIRNIKYAVIATVDESGGPWNTPVFASIDSDVNVYWDSSVDSQHSQNIAENSRVFIVIFDSGSGLAGKTRQGVYIQAKAKAVESMDELNHYSELRLKTKPIDDAEGEFLGASRKRIYKASPERIWTNDRIVVDGKKIDVRKELELP